MNEMLPLPVTAATAGRDAGHVNGINTETNTGEIAAGSGFIAETGTEKASFHDSLQTLASSIMTHEHASAVSDEGGKDLPPAELTAANIPPALLSNTADMQAQQNTVLSTAVQPGAITATAERADTATTTALSGTSSISQSIMPAQPGLAVADSTANDATVQHPGTGRAAEFPAALPLKRALNSTEALISSSSPLVRMQLAPADSSPNRNAVDKDIVVKAGLMRQPGTVEMTDLPPVLRTGGVLAESDQLFTSRMQASAVIQTGELAATRLTQESLLMQTQAAAADPLNASITRSALAQSALSAELQTMTPGQPGITETLGKADWGQGMGRQVLWMVNQNISSAELRLNPANLGPLEVRIDMDNDQVNVAFSSRHADVRDAVEQALPRLREMFEDRGLNLSDADVSQHTFAEQRDNAFEQAADRDAGPVSGMSLVAEGELTLDGDLQHIGSTGMNTMLNEGLVDYYI